LRDNRLLIARSVRKNLGVTIETNSDFAEVNTINPKEYIITYPLDDPEEGISLLFSENLKIMMM